MLPYVRLQYRCRTSYAFRMRTRYRVQSRSVNRTIGRNWNGLQRKGRSQTKQQFMSDAFRFSRALLRNLLARLREILVQRSRGRSRSSHSLRGGRYVCSRDFSVVHTVTVAILRSVRRRFRKNVDNLLWITRRHRELP